jgi:Transposase
MDAVAPKIVYIPVNCARKKAPCRQCGKMARRKRVLHRQVRTIAYKRIAYLKITYGEYRARCGCCTTFRTSPEDVLPKAAYDNRVRQAVLERILEDGLNIESVRQCMRRDFLLDLSSGFVYDCLHGAVQQLNLPEQRQHVLARFSGTLCIDELHLGQYTLLLATDPLGDFPVAFALVEANDQEHMRRFLQNLKVGGLLPRVVVTDGSNLYPTLLADLWPAAQHQLCVFHVLKDINQEILDSVKRLRRQLARQGKRGRRRRRGRPRKGQRRPRRTLTCKDKAHFVFKHRYLIVTRRENLSPRQRQDLRTMLEYVPDFAVLRLFADRLYRLFDATSVRQAWNRWLALRQHAGFAQVPELVNALAMLEGPKFDKMIAFLHSPAGQRVRTNNHVERANRKLRYYEKVRYKWRRRRTLVRFLLLALDRWWQQAFVPCQLPSEQPTSHLSEPCTSETSSTSKPKPKAA